MRGHEDIREKKIATRYERDMTNYLIDKATVRARIRHKSAPRKRERSV